MILDFMLPMGTEGAGGCESYPSNYITNKYIYDAFLMIYFFRCCCFSTL